VNGRLDGEPPASTTQGRNTMTKLVSKIATGIAILGLAAPAFAAGTATEPAPAQSGKTAQVHRRAHKKVASADTKADAKKADTKATAKKHKKSAKAKAEAPASTSAAPAPAAPATK